MLSMMLGLKAFSEYLLNIRYGTGHLKVLPHLIVIKPYKIVTVTKDVLQIRELNHREISNVAGYQLALKQSPQP